MQDLEEKCIGQLQKTTEGLTLTDSEEKTLHWLAGCHPYMVDNVAHIIEKARDTGRAGGLTQQDLFKLWGFLETLKNIFEGEIRDSGKIEDATIRDSVTTNNTKWAAEIRELQQKIDRGATGK